MRTSNPIERAVQQEIKRRTQKVRVFPNEASLIRLGSAENHQKQLIRWTRILSGFCFICGCIYCACNSVYNFLRGRKNCAWGFCFSAILRGQLAAFTLR